MAEGSAAMHRYSTLRALARIAIIMVLALATGAVRAEAVEITHQLAYRYPHVWRGITLREFPVLNASTTIAYDNGFAMNVWVGMDLSDEAGRGGEIQEIDLDLGYRWQAAGWQGTFGYVELIFPGGIDNTGELYGKVRTPGSLSGGLEVYYNVDLLRDSFVLADLRKSWALSQKLQASLVGGIAYSGVEYSKFFGGTSAGFHHWITTFDLDYAFRRLSVKVRLAYSDTLDEEVLGNQPVQLWGGVYLTTRQ